jgi:hypothetical protein
MRALGNSLLVVAVALLAPVSAWAAAPALPAAGTRLARVPVGAAETAVARFRDLARADARHPSFADALSPLAILQGEMMAEGQDEGEEPFVPAPREAYAFPVPGLASLVPSPAPAQSFAGLDDIPRVGTNSIVIPPDVDGAVGPDRILETLNNNYRLFDKADGSILSTVSINTFWAGVGAGPTFDPKTLYDPVRQRWIAVALSDARSAASSILLGISQTSDPGGAWTLYRVPGDTSGVNWVDFPCVGFNGNWIAVNVNLFTLAANTNNGARCLIVDYAQARAGTLVASFVNGTGFCSAPVATYSPDEPTLYVPAHLSSAGGTYRLDTITGTPSAPVYTVGAPRSRGVTWTQPLGQILPQAPPLAGSSFCGGPCALEPPDAQIRSTPVLRDGSIWYTQTIGLPAGVLTHTAVQWTRLDAASGNVIDGGRIDDPTATSSNGGLWYAYPHVAVNGAGDMLVCFGQFSSARFPSAGYALRFAADAAGTLRQPVVVKSGEDYYHKDFGSGRNRWGDYAKAQVDPTDDASLWMVAEYAKARVGTDDGTSGSNSSRWGTWWARVGPVLTVGAGPTVPEGDTGSTACTVPVTLSQPLPADLTVNYTVSDGTASAAEGDYDSPASSVVIPAGALAAAIPLRVHGDQRCEGVNETFTVALAASPGATLGTPAAATVTIAEDDFDCTPPHVTVLAPNGGETLIYGTTIPLTWVATDSAGVATIDLAVSRDAGATFTPIATGLANDGHFDWDVEPPASAQALLRVQAHDPDGNIGSDVSDALWNIAFATTAVPEPPLQFALARVMPDPVVDGARIGFTLPHAARARLAILDLQGRTLAVLVDGERPAGRHTVRWDGRGPRGAVAAGVYFVRCEAGGKVATRRFAVTR